MSALGEQLKQVREAKNLSLAQVAEETKIRTDHLEAIESGRFDIFAAPVYARGSVRTYVRLLKMNEQEAMEQLKQEMEPDKPRGFLKKLSFDRSSDSPFKPATKSKPGGKNWFGSTNNPESPSEPQPGPDQVKDVPPEILPAITPEQKVISSDLATQGESESPFSGSESATSEMDLQTSLPFQTANEIAQSKKPSEPVRPTQQPVRQPNAPFQAKPERTSTAGENAAASPRKGVARKKVTQESDFEIMARRARIRNGVLSGAAVVLIIFGVIIGIQWFGSSKVDQADLEQALEELGNGLYMPENHENQGVTLALPTSGQ